MKKNGFCLPWHWQQILSWVSIAAIASVFYIFTVIFFTENQLAIIVLYSASMLLVLVVAAISTGSDPSDPLLKEEIKKREYCLKTNQNYILEISKEVDFCIICCCNIHSSSKHCKECDRCVNNFDHHCTWLNNCIGDENYKIFFLLLIVVFYVLCLNIILQTYAFSSYISRDAEQESKMLQNAEISKVSLKTAAIVSLVFACFNGLIVLNVSYLILMHIWLRCKGLTTYEYIMRFVKNDQDQNCKDIIEHDIDGVDKSAQFPDSRMEMNTQNKLPLGIDKFDKNDKVENIYKGKKNRNKVIPANLFQNFTPGELQEKNIKLDDQQGKIYVEDKDFQSKIFKPIIDNIYHANNTDNKSIDQRMPFDRRIHKGSTKNALYVGEEYYHSNSKNEEKWAKRIEEMSYNDNIKFDPRFFPIFNKKV